MLSNIILTSIYILALQDNKYFISKLSKEKGDMLDSFISNTNTTDLHSVFGNGAYWIELYPIIKVDRVIEENIEDYDYIVKDYMATFGAHNVRGGSFNDIVFQQNKFYELVKELNFKYARDNLEGIEYEEQQQEEDEHEDQHQDYQKQKKLEEYAQRNHQEEYHNDDSYRYQQMNNIDYDDGYRIVRNDYDEL